MSGRTSKIFVVFIYAALAFSPVLIIPNSTFAQPTPGPAGYAYPIDPAAPDPRMVPFEKERIESAAEAFLRQGTAAGKLTRLLNPNNHHKYFKGASAAEILGLGAREIVDVGKELVWTPWDSDCMKYKWRGFCGRTFKFTVCVPIFGCADLYSWDLPTSVYREYHVPVAMADTTNVRGATGMWPSTLNWPMVIAGQEVYEKFAEDKLILDPLDSYNPASLIDLEMRRTYKAGANAMKNRGVDMPDININSDLVRPLQQLARVGRDYDQRIGNDQKVGGGSVYATWQTPPGYPIGSLVYALLDVLDHYAPPLPLPIVWPPLPFNNPPYTPVVMASLFQTCHCRRVPSLDHFVGSEFALPLLRSLSPAGVFPNILARSPAVSHWYPPLKDTTIITCRTTGFPCGFFPNSCNFPICQISTPVTIPDPEWIAKMSAQSGLDPIGNVLPAGDPLGALNADAITGGTQRWSAIPMAATIPDMFNTGNATSLIQARSGILPGTYRGNQHGWIHINERVQQAGNAAASEEAIFKAFRFAHLVWPKEYYSVVAGDDPDNSDKVQWTGGKLGHEKWGKDADEEESDCKYLGHFTPEFKKANYISDEEDVWNVAHLWKKVRCCDPPPDGVPNRPIDYGSFPYMFAGGADRYPQIDQWSPTCNAKDAP